MTAEVSWQAKNQASFRSLVMLSRRGTGSADYTCTPCSWQRDVAEVADCPRAQDAQCLDGTKPQAWLRRSRRPWGLSPHFPLVCGGSVESVLTVPSSWLLRQRRDRKGTRMLGLLAVDSAQQFRRFAGKQEVVSSIPGAKKQKKWDLNPFLLGKDS